MTRLPKLSPWLLVPLVNVVMAVSAFIWGTYIYEVVTPVLLGAATGVAFAHLQSERRRARGNKEMNDIMEKMPVKIQQLEANEEENTRTLAVTLGNGDMLTTTVPLDYSPSSDNGTLLLRAILSDEDYERLRPMFHVEEEE